MESISNVFTYHSVGNEKNNDVEVDLYSFRCLFNQIYIVEVEKHPNQIYIIKYFQKNHRDSKRRYSLLNAPQFWKKNNNAENFLTILNTIKEIIINVYYKSEKNASFGFMGAPTTKELGQNNKSNQNNDGTVSKTTRYNIYVSYVNRYFSPEQFERVDIPTSSCYLLKNTNNIKLTSERVEKFFSKYITDYC